MSDIVERLDRCSPLTIALAHEARDEIKLLRAQVLSVLSREAETTKRHDAKLDALEAEIRQLREHRDHMRAVVECAGFGSVTEALVEIDRLRAEVARLVKSRNKWGQKYNRTLEKLKLAVWTDTEYVKAVDEACVEFKQRAEAAEARLAEAAAMLHRVYFASRIDVLMEGPRLSGWNRPELDRLWPELRDLVAKLEGPR